MLESESFETLSSRREVRNALMVRVLHHEERMMVLCFGTERDGGLEQAFRFALPLPLVTRRRDTGTSRESQSQNPLSLLARCSDLYGA